MKSFLSNRLQRVTLNGAQSSWRSVTSGVPQGTVFGPLLFLLYVSDIANGLTSQIRLFADDCILYRAVRSTTDCDVLQQDINHLYKWSSTWQMVFNAKNVIY